MRMLILVQRPSIFRFGWRLNQKNWTNAIIHPDCLNSNVTHAQRATEIHATPASFAAILQMRVQMTFKLKITLEPQRAATALLFAITLAAGTPRRPLLIRYLKFDSHLARAQYKRHGARACARIPSANFASSALIKIPARKLPQQPHA